MTFLEVGEASAAENHLPGNKIKQEAADKRPAITHR